MSMTLPPVGAEQRSEPTPPAVAAATPSPAGAASKRAPGQAAAPSAIDQLRAMRKDLEQALSEANRQMQLNGRALAFSLDEKADRMVIRVTNSVTGELVRQIPDETVLRIAHSLDELKGVLYDEAS